MGCDVRFGGREKGKGNVHMGSRSMELWRSLILFLGFYGIPKNCSDSFQMEQDIFRNAVHAYQTV